MLLLGTRCWALLGLVAAAAAACCRVSLLLPLLLLSVCDTILVQDNCVRSQQLQQQLRNCWISQQLKARRASVNSTCDLLRTVDKLG
jgi:hypothetical protein